MLRLLVSFFLIISCAAHVQARIPVQKATPARLRIQEVASPQEVDGRRFEIRTAPLAFFARWFALDGSYNISPRFALGPSAIVFSAGTTGNMFFPSYNGFALGMNATWYLSSPTKKSAYLSGHIFYDNYSSYSHDSTNYNLIAGMRSNAAFGYRVIGMSGFLMMFGAGPELRVYSVSERDSNGNATQTADKSQAKVLPYAEAKVGFAF